MTDGFEEMGLPPLGHNKPPDDKRLDAEKLFDEVERLVATVNRWRAERPSIIDAEMAAAAQLMIDQLRGLRDDLGNCLRQQRRPLDDAIAAIKIVFKVPTDKVVLSLDGMLALAADWLKRERDRLEAERVEREQAAERARVEAEQLDQLANAPGASVETQLAADQAAQRARDAADDAGIAARARPRVRGDYAPKAMSLHSNWKARVVDDDAALRHFRFDPKVRKASLAEIVKVAGKLAQRHKDPSKAPPGVEFYNDERAQ